MGEWQSIGKLPPRQYKCGYCGKEVASKEGFWWNRGGYNDPRVEPKIYICPGCGCPTYFEKNTQTPAPLVGNDVEALPDNVDAMYREARQCAQAGAYTACVLACRKLLMHIAVQQGADEGQSFFQYVEYLARSGYVPPNGRAWVDHIRQKGNEANHEIVLMSRDDALELLSFLEMLLKFIFEFPARLAPSANQ